MCAPVQSTQGYKLRAKVIPGGTKKGKAVKLAIHLWLNGNEGNDTEKMVVRGMQETEFI